MLAVLAPELARGAAEDMLPPLAALPPAAAEDESRRTPALCCMADSIHAHVVDIHALCRGPRAGEKGGREKSDRVARLGPCRDIGCYQNASNMCLSVYFDGSTAKRSTTQRASPQWAVLDLTEAIFVLKLVCN